ncbi:MAG: MucB/RseB C-terminal domain-containing protein [Gammaproteobacteria bacterium]|nr:MucB/RseB C-terminal domain-containing protein [Gammaproteobacteria bacterium]
MVADRVPARHWGPAATALVAAFTCLPAHAASDPRAWLERMTEAVDTLNYEGELVHVFGGDTSVLTIVHRVENGQQTERVTADDGSCEIIRNADEVTYILPDQRTVLVEKRDPAAASESPLRGHLPGPAGVDATLYHVAFGERDRIAGRDALGVAIRPKDGYRYGYRLWLDRVTAMPLKTQLVDEQGTVLEQVLFTQITLPAHLSRALVRPTIAADSFAVRRPAAAPPGAAATAPEGWASREVPPGFRLTVRQARSGPDGVGALRHMVYTDGLATVSLFVEPAVAASEQAEGLSQIGSANAFTAIVEGRMVTAIGTVPARTVEIIAQSARPAAR